MALCILVDIGSGNACYQTITWTSVDLLSIVTTGTNFNEPKIKIPNFSFTKMHLKMSSAKLSLCFRWVFIITRYLDYQEISRLKSRLVNMNFQTCLIIGWQPNCECQDRKSLLVDMENGLFCAWLILNLHPANKRRRYIVTQSLIGWAQTKNQPCRVV